MILDIGKVQYYIDNKLAKDLEIYVDDIFDSDEDLVVLCTGVEGAGKSKFIRQIAKYIQKLIQTKYNIEVPLNYKNIHFNLNEYLESSLKGEKYQINILDESRKILNRKKANSRDATKFTDYLSECRSKNQIHFILLPAFHDIDKYILLWRCKMLLNLDKSRDAQTNKLVKGTGKNLPIDNRLLYCWDENRYRYPTFKPTKYGGYQFRFNNVEAFDDYHLYVKKKEEFMVKKYVEEDVNGVEQLKKKALEVLPKKYLAQLFEVDISTTYKWQRKLEKELEILA